MTNKSFTEFVKQCCAMREWNLRRFLNKELTGHGFRIIEDDYRSRRDGKYQTVHNMLAIRGNNPSICLAAHTDVCRDHCYGEAEDVHPVVKKMMIRGEMRKIIQDEHCQIQVGGDDRLGVAINTWIATHTNFDMGLVFFTDEEIGVCSSQYCKMPELLDFDLVLQVDRGNHSHQLVNRIGGLELCSDETSDLLIEIAGHIGLPREKVNGLLTDVYALKRNGVIKEGVNMTCGYHNSIGADRDEYIDIEEARDTVKFVESVVEYYETMKALTNKITDEKNLTEEMINELVDSSVKVSG